MGPYVLPRWSWLNMRTMANQKIGRWGWDFPHRAGRYHVWIGSDPLSCPGDAYFTNESCPMSDQTKLTCVYFRLIKFESELLSCQNRERCSRVLYLQDLSDLLSQSNKQEHCNGIRGVE